MYKPSDDNQVICDLYKIIKVSIASNSLKKRHVRKLKPHSFRHPMHFHSKKSSVNLLSDIHAKEKEILVHKPSFSTSNILFYYSEFFNIFTKFVS